jgi:hypothetical protein
MRPIGKVSWRGGLGGGVRRKSLPRATRDFFCPPRARQTSKRIVPQSICALVCPIVLCRSGSAPMRAGHCPRLCAPVTDAARFFRASTSARSCAMVWAWVSIDVPWVDYDLSQFAHPTSRSIFASAKPDGDNRGSMVAGTYISVRPRFSSGLRLGSLNSRRLTRTSWSNTPMPKTGVVTKQLAGSGGPCTTALRCSPHVSSQVAHTH